MKKKNLVNRKYYYLKCSYYCISLHKYVACRILFQIGFQMKTKIIFNYSKDFKFLVNFWNPSLFIVQHFAFYFAGIFFFSFLYFFILFFVSLIFVKLMLKLCQVHQYLQIQTFMSDYVKYLSNLYLSFRLLYGSNTVSVSFLGKKEKKNFIDSFVK